MLQLPMIERAGQNTFFYESLHKGVGDILAQRYFGGKLKWDIEVEVWELPVGGTEGSHIHDDSEPEYGAIDELYIILSGSAEMTIDGVTEVLAEGDSVLSPPGSRHNLVNIGTAPLKILIITDPPK
jgi:mannose-6-phosphate isomerase-like protein (cupin superfamily)